MHTEYEKWRTLFDVCLQWSEMKFWTGIHLQALQPISHYHTCTVSDGSHKKQKSWMLESPWVHFNPDWITVHSLSVKIQPHCTLYWPLNLLSEETSDQGSFILSKMTWFLYLNMNELLNCRGQWFFPLFSIHSFKYLKRGQILNTRLHCSVLWTSVCLNKITLVRTEYSLLSLVRTLLLM